MTAMNALTVWKGDNSSEAALRKVRADRAAAEQQIADLEIRRAAELAGECDLSSIDLLDASIAADKRAITIADQRQAIIERTLRREADARREAQRTAAIRTIEVKLRKRTAKAAELEAAVARVVELAKQIKDERPSSGCGHFPNCCPITLIGGFTISAG